MDEKQIKMAIAGLVVGAGLTAGGLFATGTAVMKSDANEMSRKAGVDAVINAYTEICVARFKESADRAAHLAELKKREYRLRAEYVNKNGWAVMPGQTKPYVGVDNECGQKIAAMEQ